MTNILFGSVSNPDEWVYHYTTRGTALELLLPSGLIRMGPFASVNDPRESKAWRFAVSCPGNASPDNDEFFAIQEAATTLVKGNSKVLCMVQDDPRVVQDGIDRSFHRGFSRPRMWAQYADNHAGVCLVLDRAALDVEIRSRFASTGTVYADRVAYGNIHRDDYEAFTLDYGRILQSSLDEVLREKVASHYRSYFFTKAEDWRSELEWRWVVSAQNAEPEFVSVRDSLRAVILGVDFPSVYDPTIAALADEYRVDVARMTWANGLPVVVPGPYSPDA